MTKVVKESNKKNWILGAVLLLLIILLIITLRTNGIYFYPKMKCTPSCEETDNGINYNLGGVASVVEKNCQKIAYLEYCKTNLLSPPSKNGKYIHELYCKNGKLQAVNHLCKTTNGCIGDHSGAYCG